MLVLLLGALFLSATNRAFADYSVPVSHSHNAREHNHQLPKEGVYHRHGIGQIGKPIRSRSSQQNSRQNYRQKSGNNTVIYSNTTTIPNKPKTTHKPPKPVFTTQQSRGNNSSHTHGGREHQHPLPAQGVFHRHGGDGPIGQRVVNTTGTVIYNDTRSFPKLDSKPPTSIYNNQTRNSSNGGIRQQQGWTPNRKWKFGNKRSLSKFTKSSQPCESGRNDCNVCAVNVKQQFQKAASKQINWSRKHWNFNWPQSYGPKNVRPLDIFDGDPKYALGIPDTHVQGFVKTNNRMFPYAGSHNHKRNGGIFVVQQGKNRQMLSSLHKTKSRHPSGVQVIGRYLIWGEGTRLYFKDMNSRHQAKDFSLTASKANFGGGLGIVKLGKDNHLLVVTGPGGQKKGPRFNRFYHLKSTVGRPTSLSFIGESPTKKPQQWPSILNYSENMSLVTECGTGDIYSIHTTGDDGIGALAGKGYWRLSKLTHTKDTLSLTAINAFTTPQDMKRCNARATATVNVNKQKRLEFLCHGYAKDPDGSGFNILGKSSRNRDKFYYNVGTVR